MENKPINPDWQQSTDTSVNKPAKQSFINRLKLVYQRPWMKSVLISLMIVFVGLGTSYAVYYKQKKASQKNAQTTTVTEPTSSDSSLPGSTEAAASQSSGSQSSNSSSSNTSTSSSQSESNSSSGGSSGNSGGSSGSTVQTKTINDAASEFVAKSYGYCTALAPNDWSFTANAEATGADLWSPDLNFHAGWGIAFAYSYLLPNDEAFLNYYLKLVYNTQNVSLTSSPEDVGYGYSRRYYSGHTDRDFKGAVYYQHYDAASLGGYIMVTRFGTTELSRWDNSGALAQAAALSIRCTTQLKSSNSGNTPSNSSDNDEASIDISDKWQEAIMGYENVYNPSTGQHWEAPTSSYWDTGPQGPGYYHQNGNDLTKLSRGFGSY